VSPYFIFFETKKTIEKIKHDVICLPTGITNMDYIEENPEKLISLAQKMFQIIARIITASSYFSHLMQYLTAIMDSIKKNNKSSKIYTTR